MRTPSHIIFSLLLVLGLVTLGGAQNFGQCVDQLIQSPANSAGDICPALNEYIKCVLRELGPLNLTPENITSLMTQLDTQLRASGVRCVFDFEALLREVEGETNQGNETSTIIPPPGFEEALTLGECIDALTRTVSSAGGLTCAIAEPYVKCLVRVLDFSEQASNATAIQEFEEQVESELRNQNVDCDLDVQQIIDELFGMATTTTTLTTPTTPTTTTTMPTTPTTSIITSITRIITSTTTTAIAPEAVDCVSPTPGGCVDRYTDDYPACAPLCEQGIYISCIYGQLLIRDCPLGWYFNGSYHQAKLVYDPDLRRCEYRSPSCPRALDNEVL